MMPAESQVSSVPSTVPDFNDNDYYFRICAVDIHYRSMTITSAVFGFLGISIVFSLAVWKFSWSTYEDSFDVVTIIGFVVFLLLGTIVHLFILISVKKNIIIMLNPALLFHAFLILLEFITGLTAVGELLTSNLTRLDESEIFAKEVLILIPLMIVFDFTILYVLLQFRYYLRHLHTSTAIHGTITPVFFGTKQTKNPDEEKPPIE